MKKYEIWFDNDGEYLMLGFAEGINKKSVINQLNAEGYVTDKMDLYEV